MPRSDPPLPHPILSHLTELFIAHIAFLSKTEMFSGCESERQRGSEGGEWNRKGRMKKERGGKMQTRQLCRVQMVALFCRGLSEHPSASQTPSSRCSELPSGAEVGLGRCPFPEHVTLHVYLPWCCSDRCQALALGALESEGHTQQKPEFPSPKTSTLPAAPAHRGGGEWGGRGVALRALIFTNG